MTILQKVAAVLSCIGALIVIGLITSPFTFPRLHALYTTGKTLHTTPSLTAYTKNDRYYPIAQVAKTYPDAHIYFIATPKEVYPHSSWFKIQTLYELYPIVPQEVLYSANFEVNFIPDTTKTTVLISTYSMSFSHASYTVAHYANEYYIYVFKQ